MRKQLNEGWGDTTRERAQHLMKVEEVTYDWLVYYYIEIDLYCNRTYGCKTFLFSSDVITMYSCAIHSFTLYSFYENAGMLVGLYIISFVIALLGQ